MRRSVGGAWTRLRCGLAAPGPALQTAQPARCSTLRAARSSPRSQRPPWPTLTRPWPQAARPSKTGHGVPWTLLSADASCRRWLRSPMLKRRTSPPSRAATTGRPSARPSLKSATVRGPSSTSQALRTKSKARRFPCPATASTTASVNPWGSPPTSCPGTSPCNSLCAPSLRPWPQGARSSPSRPHGRRSRSLRGPRPSTRPRPGCPRACFRSSPALAASSAML